MRRTHGSHEMGKQSTGIFAPFHIGSISLQLERFTSAMLLYTSFAQLSSAVSVAKGNQINETVFWCLEELRLCYSAQL